MLLFLLKNELFFLETFYLFKFFEQKAKIGLAIFISL